MIEDVEKDNEFYRRAVKINSIAIAWNVYDVYDKERILHGVKFPKGFRFLDCRWRIDKKIASGATQLCPKIVIHTDYDCYNLKNRMKK